MTRTGPCSLQIMGYLLLAGIVLGVNLLPAFGPPTWAVLVFFPLAIGPRGDPSRADRRARGCMRTSRSRASGSRRFRSRLSPKRIENLEAVRDAIAGGPKRAVAGLALFAFSQVPSRSCSSLPDSSTRRCCRDRGVLRRTDHQLHDLRDRRIRSHRQPGHQHGERVQVPARHSATTAGPRRPRRPAADRLGTHRHAPAGFWGGGWHPSRLERIAIRISCEPVIGGTPSPPLTSHPTPPALLGAATSDCRARVVRAYRVVSTPISARLSDACFGQGSSSPRRIA